MCSRQLTGRVLTDWTDADLAAFCQWYNVGWVVARNPMAVERWGKFPQAKPVAQLAGGRAQVVIYALDRPRSFVLSGTATWESADARRIVLTNVVPNAEGQVHLSLHHLEGLRASRATFRCNRSRTRPAATRSTTSACSSPARSRA